MEQMTLERQLNIFDIFDDLDREKDSTTVEQYQREFSKLIQTLPKHHLPLAKMISTIFYSPNEFNIKRRNVSKDFKELTEMIETQTYHYYSLKTGNHDVISSVQIDKGSYVVFFRIGDQTLMMTNSYNSSRGDNVEKQMNKLLREPIRFPTSCINMFDNEGNALHFNTRESFIMERLGFAEIGKLNEVFKAEKTRLFCTVEATMIEITEFLKRKDKKGSKNGGAI